GGGGWVGRSYAVVLRSRLCSSPCPGPRRPLFPCTTLFRSLAAAVFDSAEARGVSTSVDPASTSFLLDFGVENFLRETSTVDIVVDRKSTRLNSSHVSISYAVFCLKKKNTRKDSVLVSKRST